MKVDRSAHLLGCLGTGNQAGQPHSKEEEWRRRLRAERKKAARSGRPRRQPVPGGVHVEWHPQFFWLQVSRVPSREFYSYEAKYLDEGSALLVPASLTKRQTQQVQQLAVEACLAIDGAGMARVDFLMARDTGRLYLNELNTIPVEVDGQIEACLQPVLVLRLRDPDARAEVRRFDEHGK